LRLVLASGSPRRSRLLADAGYTFDVVAPDVDETPSAGESPTSLVERLAMAKAVAVAQTHPDAAVLGADTVVVLDHRILGKPADAGHADDMLRDLSGRDHTVLTGWAIAHPAGCERNVTVTTVTFRALSAGEISDYVGTGEPMDKAGAYAIQGGAAGFATGIAGSYRNIVGLPVGDLYPILLGLGICPRRPDGSTD